MTTQRIRRTIEERFWPKVEVRGPDECWPWLAAQAGRPDARYGRLWGGTRTNAGHALSLQAHRVAYEIVVGPIPEGLELDHLCRNTICVNPKHLEPVTRLENSRRGNSPMAKQGRKTHCKRGHPFDEANTYRWKGLRRCRRCNADQQAEIRTRKAAA